MLTDTKAYSGLAVRDLDETQTFYRDTLGLRTSEEYGLMWLHLAGGRDTLIYEQPGATPASFTILNFEVDDIDEAVDALTARGVRFDLYPGLEQDDRGVFREEVRISPGSRTRRATCYPSSKRSRRNGAHQSSHNRLASQPSGT
jgi:catechol 2,3-dioxygenase-like lactoylglutathione lyase family enzyme